MNESHQTHTSPHVAPRWATRWLIAAGVYNLVWGAVVVAVPNLIFDLLAIPRPNYPQIWQCVGMIVGVYGVGYLIASVDPRRHWPIVLVGLLGKILGPLGFLWSIREGSFPAAFGVVLLSNDLIWWVPFAMMLWDAARYRDEPASAAVMDVDAALDVVRTDAGESLLEVSRRGPTLLVLLRHSGCTFCRETLADLHQCEAEIRQRGYAIAIVSMSGAETNQVLAQRYGLTSAHWFSDSERVLYRALDLRRGKVLELFGPAVIFRGLAALWRGAGVGALDGDGFQMPGAFVLEQGRVVRAFRHRHAGERPDYDAMACEITG